MDYEWDCVVVGGGPAGLSAALTLGRARRRVLVLDSGAPRNYAAREMHGVLGHDGLPPAELRARGHAELARYGIEVREADVEDPAALEGARTVILATGMLDDTPDIDGFDAIYGISAHTCPYCDGFEHADKRLAVLAPPAGAAHMGPLLRQWSPDVVLFTPAVEDRAPLDALGVRIVDEPVVRFHHDAGLLTGIELAGGEVIERDALFFNVAMRPRVSLATALGCELNDAGYIVADPLDRQTSVDGVYAIGNCTDPMQNVPMAIADGARAGAFLNARLVGDGIVQPLMRAAA
jgi:thioredoxin reductase